MVSTDGIADVRLFLALLSKLGTIESMGHLGIFIRHFTDVMQQAGTLGLLGVETQFGSHHGTQVGRFARVLQEVLTVGRTVLHLTDDAEQFRVQAMYTQIDGRTLTRLHDFLLYLPLHLGHHLLDAGWMNTSVGHELMECQSAYLTTYGVEGRDDDSLRRVVHDNLHTRSSLQRTDVASLASNDTSLDVVVVDVEDRDAVLHSRLSSHTLYGLDDDALGFLIGIELGLVHDVIDIGCRCRAGFVLQTLDELLLSLLLTQTADFLQLGALLLHETGLALVEFLLTLCQGILLLLGACTQVLHLQLLAVQVILTLVETHLTLLDAVLALLNLLVALLDFLLQLRLLVEELLLDLKELLLFQHFGLLFRLRLELGLHLLEFGR